MVLSERKQKILTAVIERYIASGEAVGSKLLLDMMNLPVSSATVRNELSELSEMGYLIQPHTSAGRIPSDRGYRYYVDNLMKNYELSDSQRRLIEKTVDAKSGDPEQILEQAGETLARLTNCAVLTAAPGGDTATVRGIELIRVGNKTLMMVLMTSTGIIKSKLCRMDFAITKSTVEIFYNVINHIIIGRQLIEIDTALLQTIVSSIDQGIFLLSPLFATLSDLVGEASGTQIILDGQSNLLHHRELLNDAYELMTFLKDTEPITRMVTAGKKDIEIRIGQENIYRPLKNTSVIISRYSTKSKSGGALGVIGPTRMDYARLIPNIKYLSEHVERIFNDILE